MHFSLTEEGYLKNKNDWNKNFSILAAEAENIMLSPEHWQIIHFFQHFYEAHHLTPSMRILIKYLRTEWPAEKANSAYVQGLFPKSVMLQASLLAGLPKPSHCL
ncbi:MAG: hypothetical protein ACD_44C00106G0003 [uncultured bacterium]|nr:MAG: hypothetical protein ACD_44C00106G0003 [uncultured bacterium]OGT15656.1 MAG: hypothetical protein A3B69_04695 [Gammaproteobacteria bacterium RIFCSPHIGHO2_02_FULL_38_33]OGT23378.1 MAG: hypothetical protein A2W47_04100 [Gammaproteobacteria bacterium RIFCSPHIGHO2_12_38_15]OGT66833.1 MAG: hypothetical protein A3I12_02095 [Gammaproteobacteria bacterium RIFCSPLOWO2_02_FULL_38_11]OGT75948.1 MAG: hypothetical protein A3G71_04470 [Gammaproteobacteria bacterium RIFCSPLOWO2_12_FULL_38_14]